MKKAIAMILLFGGILGMIGALIASMIFSFKNPDMTEMRKLIENPEPTIVCVGSLVAAYAGLKLQL